MELTDTTDIKEDDSTENILLRERQRTLNNKILKNKNKEMLKGK
jgi:hypothetical protein